DGIVMTGPITKNMAPALRDAYDSISNPRIVIAFGACTISGGIFSESNSLNRTFLDKIKIDLYVPGCPPHPLTFINSIINMMQKKN
ncbi:MAG: NADH-quinone oxidoreductase subunit B, partial [Ignavibacteriaceae bacterium]